MARIAAITPKVQRFIELERKKEEIKKYFDELNAAIEAVAQEVGVDTYFKDPTDGTVFQIVVPDGRFVHYEKYGYVRTKREGEVRGTLAAKTAEEVFGKGK